MSIELTCKEVVEIVTDYLEDALSPEDRARFDQHLAVCDGCSFYVEQMRETIRLSGMVTEERIPRVAARTSAPGVPGLEDRLKSAVLSLHHPESTTRGDSAGDGRRKSVTRSDASRDR